MRKLHTKSALLTSAIALLLCFVMLLGTTFAWFTDSVTSANNKIQAGTLKIDLLVKDVDEADYTSVKNDSKAIFDYENWEPGYVEAKNVKVSTNGTLALKYTLKIVPNGDVENLADVIEVYYAPTEVAVDRTLAGLTKIGTLRDVINGAQGTILDDQLIPAEAAATLGETANTEDFATIALKMMEEAGNEYQGTKIGTTFDINLFATQFTYEEDSFDNQYDAESTYPVVASAKVEAGTTEATVLTAEEVSAEIPAGAAAGVYKLNVTNKKVEETVDGTAVSYDIDLTKDGVKVEGVSYPVKIFVGYMLDISEVKHNGEDIASFDYDPTVGYVTFETTSFSPFEIVYTEIGKEVEAGLDENGEFAITEGIFEGINPADYDEKLAEEGSEYIAVNYTANGKECFVIADRATTAILKAPDTVYSTDGKNYSVTEVPYNQLYTYLTKSKGYKTVYLLPGTYEAATTLTVDGSLDIIGLGDAENILVRKIAVHTTKTKVSNQHLFNCTSNDASAPYIEVTIRNLSLEALEKNTYVGTIAGKTYTRYADNAAVQSIRRAKVKCYDLIINKDATDSSACAFYVNASNKASDGKIYPAYMYAENCTLNSKNAYSVVSTSGSYKFYHNGVTYNGGTAYTNNSGSIKNVVMEADDWDW